MTRAMWTVFIVLYALALALILYSIMAMAHARDLEGRYAVSPNSEWVRGLKNKAGGLCCDTADGHRLEDVDWRGEADGSYSVRVDGAWVKLDDSQVLTEPNRLGVAMVWVFQGRITCFIPGGGF